MRARPFSLARAFSAGMASRHRRNMARTLTPLTWSQCSSVISSTKARPLTPALLNRMSMAPNLASAAATIFLGASSPVMSQPKAAMALLPACACSIADSGRSTASTCAPSSANSLAEAAPMPEAAPVTIAILPVSVSPSSRDGFRFTSPSRWPEGPGQNRWPISDLSSIILISLPTLPVRRGGRGTCHSTFTPDACATRCHSARSFSSTSANALAPAPTGSAPNFDQPLARLGRQGRLDEGALELRG